MADPPIKVKMEERERENKLHCLVRRAQFVAHSRSGDQSRIHLNFAARRTRLLHPFRLFLVISMIIQCPSSVWSSAEFLRGFSAVLALSCSAHESLKFRKLQLTSSMSRRVRNVDIVRRCMPLESFSGAISSRVGLGISDRGGALAGSRRPR